MHASHVLRALFALPAAVAFIVALTISPGHAQPRPGKGDKPTVIESYAGTVLCADCPGIRMELSLFEDSLDPFRKTFVLRESWLKGRHPARTAISRGSWTFLRGMAANPDATVYELMPDDGGAPRHFLLAGDGTLRLLDGDMRELPAALPHTLKRTQNGAIPGAAPNHRLPPGSNRSHDPRKE